MKTTRPGSRLVLAAVGAIALTSLAACGGSSSTAEQPKENKISVGDVPDYYPSDYSDLVDEAKNEGGQLTIYSNTAEENWAPIFRDFQKKYTWVKKLSANDLDSDEVFQRAQAESATGDSPVDLLVSNASVAWAKYAADDSKLMAYDSPEAAKLPDFAELLPNVFAMSVDPMTIAYNTELVTQAPTGVADLAKLAASDPETYQDKITVRDPESSFGFTVTHAFTEANPNGWADLEKVLPYTRAETSSGTQMEKILSGEYVAGFFISGGPAFPVVDDSDGLVDVVYPDDGTVVLPRGVGIAADAPHPALAKLFIDFLLSDEGQRAVAEGGLSSYREGISGPGLHTYQEAVDEVGEDKVIFADYKDVADPEIKTWLDKFYTYVKPAPEEE